MKFTQADWEQHVANNHVPYRRDCAVCVHGAGNGRRHQGVVHPDVCCMSDIAGPIRVKGKDPESRNHRPATFKYFLAVSYRFPRLKGVKEESDPTDSDVSEARALYKSEPVYTPNVELLLDALQEPLQVVHTVDPRDAEQCIEKWMPAIHKEIGVIEKAARRLPPAEVRSGGWLKRKDVKVVPSKFVFTVKPPDPAEGEASLASRKGQAYHKRKARLVACGNHAPGTGSEVYASGAAAKTLRCFVVISSKRRWCIGSPDVTSAFLLTPIPQGKGFPVFALTPPRLLVRLGLAEEGELWILTHAVYGLRESPKLWSDFRDCQLRALRCVVDGVELQLQQGRLDPNWWRVVRTSDGVVVGGLLTYVDDFLLAGSKEVIVATAIQGIWKNDASRTYHRRAPAEVSRG